jgi:3-hydroxybutyryl-CoA dehydratase|tara:strand:+ start:99 stop:509 length:411 start_codon:yes stop_codon:yes gene_type:complete
MLLTERFKIGMKESLSKKITESDIIIFSKISGDKNPIHLSDEFAKKTRFKKRIAHGYLSASLFSGIFGEKLPGPGCLYLSQSLQFKYPVYIDDIVIATVKIIDIVAEKNILKFSTICKVDKTTVIDGIAEIYIPKQ